jgi:ribosomal protein L16 Arg81 hydroxylase
VILAMGEVLYIPSDWLHYIVSQDANVQCNARSGVSATIDSHLEC